MAASMQDENIETEEKKDENNNSDGDLEDDWLVDSDTSDPLADGDRLSLFCKNCLSLYEGEEIKDDNFILRCTNCDYRDIIPMTDMQGTVYEKEPQLLVGDLLHNRFHRIIKANDNDEMEANVASPDYRDDQYRKYFYLHSKLFDKMNTNICDMNNMIDECRKQHNEKMIESIVDRRAKQLEEGLQDTDEKIEVVGAQENGTLIISPDEFKVPDCVKIKCLRMRKAGLREADKIMLENGIADTTIESMPLFKKRISLYKVKMEVAEKINNTKRPDKNLHRREKPEIDKSSNDRSKPESNVCLENNTDKETSLITGVEIETKKKCKKKKSKSSRKRIEKDRQIPLKNSASTDDKLAAISLQQHKHITPEEQKSFDEQYNLSKYVMQDVEGMSDLNDFIIEKTNDAVKEIIQAMLHLREYYLEERRKDRLKQSETAVCDMTSQVKVVRQQIIDELKNAYKSKMVRSHRQKKKLQESQQQMEECNEILQSYQEMGIYDDRLVDILDRIGKICHKN